MGIQYMYTLRRMSNKYIHTNMHTKEYYSLMHTYRDLYIHTNMHTKEYYSLMHTYRDLIEVSSRSTPWYHHRLYYTVVSHSHIILRCPI